MSTAKNKNHDPVNHPSHYQTGAGFEVMDIIEAYDLGFCDGNVIKYVLRWKNKDGLQDLNKALWYLNRMIAVETKKQKATTE